MSDYNDLEQFQNANLEDRLSALAHEMARRIPTIRGYAVLITQWLESQEAKDVPEIVPKGIKEIIEESDELWRVLKIMTKRSDL